MKKKIGMLFILMVLLTLPAIAGRVDVANEAGFGALQSTNVGAVIAYDSGTVRVIARVYNTGGGVYTYVYQVDLLSGNASTDIELFTLYSVMFDNVGLSFGTVGAPGVIGSFSFGNNMTYTGTSTGSGTLIDALGGGQWASTTFVVYAQSRMLPSNIVYQVADGLAANSTTRGPLRPPTMPEPGTLALLGGSLLSLAWFRRRS